MVIIGAAACSKNDGTTPQPAEMKTMTISEVRALSTGASVKVPDGRKIKGTVISDAAAKNIDAKTVVLQERLRPKLGVSLDGTPTRRISLR